MKISIHLSSVSQPQLYDPSLQPFSKQDWKVESPINLYPVPLTTYPSFVKSKDPFENLSLSIYICSSNIHVLMIS